MPIARSVAQVVAGEATSGTPAERLADMRAIASVIANRAQALGISQEDVVANTNEFNSYGTRMPPGTAALTDMAQEAIDHVAVNGPTTSATFYATPAATDNLPSGLNYETATTGHQFFSDPAARAIGAANGYMQPNQYAQFANPTNVPVPASQDTVPQQGMLASMFSPQPTAIETGVISDPSRVAVAPVPGPTVEGWSNLASAAPVEASTQGVLGPAVNNYASLANAGPMTTPMNSVQASGILGGAPNLAASAVAAPATDTSNFDTSRFGDAIDTSGFNPDRFGPAIDTAGFDPSRFNAVETQATGEVAGNAPLSASAVAPVGFDSARFGPVDTPVAPDVSNFNSARFGPAPAFDAARFGPVIDVATNTQSFAAPTVSAPATGLLAGAAPIATSATVPSTGMLGANAITSPNQMQIPGYAAIAQSQLNAPASISNPDLSSAINPAMPSVPSFTQQPQFSIPDAFANAYVPSAPSPDFQAAAKAINAVAPSISPAPNPVTISAPAAPTTTPGILSGAPIGSLAAPVSTSLSSGILGPTGLPQSALSTASIPDGYFSSFEAVPSGIAQATNLSQPVDLNPASPYSDVAAPALETKQITEQPTIAGPVNVTPTQQQAAVAPDTSGVSGSGKVGTGLLSGFMNKPTIASGLLGALAAGPIGALAGGLLGSSINSGTLGSTANGGGITNLGSGVQAAYGAYGAGTPGVTGTATDGSQITSQAGGWTTRVSPTGVVTSQAPYGGYAQPVGGGFFGGMFGGGGRPTPSGGSPNGASGGAPL